MSMSLRNIAAAVSAIEKQIREEKDRHEAAMLVLDAELRSARSGCPHTLIRHHYALCSGGDFDECELCGWQSR